MKQSIKQYEKLCRKYNRIDWCCKLLHKNPIHWYDCCCSFGHSLSWAHFFFYNVFVLVLVFLFFKYLVRFVNVSSHAHTISYETVNIQTYSNHTSATVARCQVKRINLEINANIQFTRTFAFRFLFFFFFCI